MENFNQNLEQQVPVIIDAEQAPEVIKNISENFPTFFKSALFEEWPKGKTVIIEATDPIRIIITQN